MNESLNEPYWYISWKCHFTVTPEYYHFLKFSADVQIFVEAKKITCCRSSVIWCKTIRGNRTFYSSWVNINNSKSFIIIYIFITLLILFYPMDYIRPLYLQTAEPIEMKAFLDKSEMIPDELLREWVVILTSLIPLHNNLFDFLVFWSPWCEWCWKNNNF